MSAPENNNDNDVLSQYDSISDSTAKVEFLKSLSTESKAVVLDALRKRLEDAKAAKAAAPAQAPQFPPPKLCYAYVGGKRGGGGDDDFFDDEDDQDDLDDDYDDELQRFEAELGIVGDSDDGTSQGTPMSHSAFGSNAGGTLDDDLYGGDGAAAAVLVTDPFARRKEVGDFELLRLAKMGDTMSFKEYETMTGTNVLTFADNNQRDALHYAADSGSLELVRYLVEEKKMPLRKDDKLKATPLDIAVLVDAPEVVSYLTSRFPRDPKSLEETLAAFRPAPPRFCLSKAAPVQSPAQRPRQFWSDDVVTPSSGEVQLAVEVLDGSVPAVVATVARLINRSNTGEHTGVDTWTLPMTEGAITEVLRRAAVFGVSATNKDGHVSAAGAGLALTVADAVGGTAVVTKDALACRRVVYCGQCNVVPAFQHRCVMGLLLNAIRKHCVGLCKDGGFVDETVALFRCPERLPVVPVAMVKWFRRSLQVVGVFRHLLAASEVFPDFYQYDDKLRVDSVVRETLAEAQKASSPTIAKWVEYSADPSKGAAVIAAGLPALLASNKAEFFVGLSTQSAVEETLGSSDLRTYFIPSADGASITDIVVLRIRSSREKQHDDASTPALRCACGVFSAFSTISAENRVLEQLIMASMLQCDVLYLPSTCGLTDSDFSKLFFEETSSYREHLYAVKPAAADPTSSMPVSVVKATVAASKVFVPLGLF